MAESLNFSRVESILESTLGYEGAELPVPMSRVEELLVELKDKIDSGGGGGGTSNYSDLTNKPQIAGVTLEGNKTLGDLGIVNYDDTAVRALIADKVDKVAGKQLSTEDYTSEEKTKLAGLSNYDDTAVRALIAAKQDQLTFDSAPTSGSTNPVTSGGIYSTLLPITQAEYDAIETKTLPIYFVYETDAQTLMQSSFPNAVNDITVVPSAASLMSAPLNASLSTNDDSTDDLDAVTEQAFTFKPDAETTDVTNDETSSSFDFFSEEES